MNTQEKIISFIQFQLPALAWCLFIYIASSIPMAKLPPLENYSDKVVHASVFAVLCWLMHVALYHQGIRSIKKYSLWIAVCFVLIYGISDEYHQLFTPGRSTDPYDVAADLFGGLLYASINMRYKFYRNE